MIQVDAFARDGRPLWSDVAQFSAEWYRRWRGWWVARFPDVDEISLRNLDELVCAAERREGRRAA